MKNLVLFALLLITGGSCKERHLLNSIEGRWRVESIELYSRTGTTALSPKNAYLDFEDCRNKNNKNSNCQLSYTSENGQVYRFNYHTTRPQPGVRLVVRLNDNSTKDSAATAVAKILLGTYLPTFTTKQVTLRCSDDCQLTQMGQTPLMEKKIVATQMK